MRDYLLVLCGLLLAACTLTGTDEVVEITPTDTPPAPEITEEATAEVGCVPRADWGRSYTIVAGDTLGAIALNAGLTVTELAQGNCLEDPNSINIGQQLRLPGFSPPVAEPTSSAPPQTYTSPVVGLALELPSNWTIRESDGYIAFFGTGGEIVEINYGPAGQSASPSQQVTQCLNANACLGNRRVLDQQPVRLPSGISGIRVDFSADLVDGDPGPSVAVFMVISSRSVIMRTFNNRVIFDQMLNSLRPL